MMCKVDIDRDRKRQRPGGLLHGLQGYRGPRV